jgi:hypothetical protein
MVSTPSKAVGTISAYFPVMLLRRCTAILISMFILLGYRQEQSGCANHQQMSSRGHDSVNAHATSRGDVSSHHGRGKHKSNHSCNGGAEACCASAGLCGIQATVVAAGTQLMTRYLALQWPSAKTFAATVLMGVDTPPPRA